MDLKSKILLLSVSPHFQDLVTNSGEYCHLVPSSKCSKLVVAFAGGLSPESLLRADRGRAQDLGGSEQEKTLPREIKFLPITANYATKGRTRFQLPSVSSNPHLWALEIKWCDNRAICRKTDKYIPNPNDLLSQPGHSLASLLNGHCKNGAPGFDHHKPRTKQ